MSRTRCQIKGCTTGRRASGSWITALMCSSRLVYCTFAGLIAVIGRWRLNASSSEIATGFRKRQGEVRYDTPSLSHQVVYCHEADYDVFVQVTSCDRATLSVSCCLCHSLESHFCRDPNGKAILVPLRRRP